MDYFIITKNMAWKLYASGEEVLVKVNNKYILVKNVSDLNKGKLFVKPTKEHLARVEKLLSKRTILDSLLFILAFLGLLIFGVVVCSHIFTSDPSKQPNIYVGIVFGIIGVFSLHAYIYDIFHTDKFHKELLKIHQEEINKLS